MAIQFPPLKEGDPQPVDGETYLYLPTKEEYVCRRASMAQTPQWTPKGVISESTFAYQGLAFLRGPAPQAITGWLYSSAEAVPKEDINSTWIGLAGNVDIDKYQLIIYANPDWVPVANAPVDSPWIRTSQGVIQPRIDGDDLSMDEGSYLINELGDLPD